MDHKYPADSEVLDSTLRARLGTSLEFRKELAPLTTFKTGGTARYYLAARQIDDMVRAVKAANEFNLPIFLIGGGSNLLVSDSGFDGIIVKMDIRGLRLIGETGIEAGAGEDLMALVNYAAEYSLSGLEFASGIWGTVGGAIFGNAGAYGGEIGKLIREVTLVDQKGEIKSVDREYCQFGYRDSYFKKTGEMIIKAQLDLKPGNAVDIRSKIKEILAVRNTKFPPHGKSAGCFFKNVPDSNEKYGKLPAGRLLEEAGAGDISVGGACVYEKHANLIINSNAATSKDIRELADKLKEKVFDKFGIRLEEEVTQVGEF
ncbi:MAG: UDP-N-acetylmuramate dehydrogenase [candidate division Zixibacteria bacterium]|nr:UDP-N-acetylmuramate dehydrogenase [candidate division Zixibacteria bacterium]